MTETLYINEAIVAPSPSAVDGSLAGDCLVICPSIDRWNDFGMRLRVEVFCYSSRRMEIIKAPSKMLVLGNEPSNADEFFSKVNTAIPVRKLLQEGTTLVLSLGSRDGYRDIVRSVGPESAKRLLLLANDVGALNAFSPGSKILLEARATKGFDRGLLRTEEAQFAYISLQKILAEDNAAGPTNVTRISTQVDFEGRMTLPFTFEFNEVLDQLQPLNVLIGPNGMGKTRLLLALASAVLKGKAQIERSEDAFDMTGFDAETNAPVVSFTYERQRWSRLARAGVEVVPMGISSANWKLLTSMIQELMLDDDEQRFNLRALEVVLKRVLKLEDLFFPVAVSEATEGNIPAEMQWVTFEDLVSQNNVAKLAALDRAKAPKLVSRTYGEYSLSSGQKGLVLFCAALFLKAKRGSLVLIDEPENHLHPQFISLLMETLTAALIGVEARAIVVTHSPFVVREVDRNAVVVVQRDPNGVPATYRPLLQTLGGDVAMIADHIFGDTSIRKGFEKQIDVFLGEDRASALTDVELATVSATLGVDGARYIRQKCKGDQRD